MKKLTKKKIIFVGGGTLGHVVPILPLATMLKQNGWDIYFIGTVNGLEQKILQNENLFTKKYFLDMVGFNRKNIFKNIKFIYKYILCNKKCKTIFSEISPDIVVGMGGYISGVVLKKAHKSKIKTIIHEQNSILGLSNKYVYKDANKVLLSFPIENISGKVIGNPRISQFKNFKELENTNEILIVSGSRGSKIINDFFLSIASELQKYKLTIITGNSYFMENQETIKQISSGNINILPFVNNLIPYLEKTSLVISRSGATTLNEIMGLCKVSILIPSPNVTSNHQYYNALYLKNAGGCELVEEKDLEKEKMLLLIDELMNKYLVRKNIKNNIMKITNYNALDDFIKEVEELYEKI